MTTFADLSPAQKLEFRKIVEPVWLAFKRDVHPRTTSKEDREAFSLLYPVRLAELERCQVEAYESVQGPVPGGSPKT